MKRLFTRWLLFTLLIVMSITTAMAQKSVLNESFSSGSLPSDWTMTSGYWNFDAGNAFFLAPFENGADTLFSQLLDISELDNKPSIAFTYSIAENATKVNELKVLYRASEDDDWSVWQTFDAATDGQVYIKDVLPDGLSEVQIAIAGAYKLGGDARVYRIAVENKTEASAAPTGLKTEDLTTTSVTLWWDVCESDMFQQYNVKINTTQMTDMSAIADVVDNVGWFITDEFYELEGLTPNTEYWVYVQYDCGDGDVSPWAELSFRTPCAAITTPFFENFEGELSSCFTVIKEGSAAAVSSEYAYNSNKSFKSVSTSGKYNYLILPEAKNNVSAFQVSLWAAAQESGNTYARTVTIGVCTEATAEAFTEVKTLSLPQGRKWEQITVSLASYPGAGKYVALRIGNADKENRLFIDDIRVEAASDCPKPMFVEVSEITPNTAKFKWVETGNASEWNLAISTKPLADPEDLVDIADPTKGESIGNVTSNPYTATGLNANTTYYAYLQSGCDEAEWTSVVEFKTARPVTFPYSEHFDRMDPDVYTNSAYATPDGWVMDLRDLRDGDSYDNPKTDTTFIGRLMTTKNHEITPYVGASLQLKGQSISSGTAAIAMMPAMQNDININELMVSFWALSTNGTQQIAVGVASNQSNAPIKGQQLGVNIIPIDTVTIPANEWTKCNALLTKYTGEGRYITFFVVPPASATPTIFIDDIEIDYAPNCNAVSTVSATATGTDKATATWTDASSSTSWIIKVSSTEIDPSTADGDIVAAQTVNTKSYDITGLNMGGTYCIYVSPTCGDAWMSTTVTTLVGLQVPYYNDFTDEYAGTGASRGPKNWVTGLTNTPSPAASSTYQPYVFGTAWTNPPADVVKYCLRFNNSATTATGASGFPYAVMPELLNADVKDLKMSFYAYYNSTTTTANYAAKAGGPFGVLKVGVVNKPSDIDKTNQFGNVTEIAAVRCKEGKVAEKFVIDFSAYTGSGKYIVFYADTAKYNDIQIDNLSITLASAPQQVTGIEASEQTETSVKLTWTENGKAAKWEVKVFAEAPEDVDAATPIFTQMVTAKEVTVTGLTHSTQYFAYVRSIQDNGKGAWGGTSFWTKTGTWAVPFVETFNSFATGSATNNTLPPYYDVSASLVADKNYPYVRAGSLSNAKAYDGNAFNFQTTSTNTLCQLLLPPLDKPINTLQMSMVASPYSSSASYLNNGSYTQIGVVEGDGTFKEMAHLTISDATKWTEWFVNFGSYAGPGGQIAIRQNYNASGAKVSTYLMMDQIVVEEIPLCGRITSIDIADIDSTSATISWAKGKTENAWNLKVSSMEIDPATATGDIFDAKVTEQTKALTNLDGNTKYYVYVQSVDETLACSGQWSNAASFKTLCKLQTFPYEEDFESYETGSGKDLGCMTQCGDDKGSYVTTKGTKALWLRQVTKDHDNYFVFPALSIDSVKRLQLSMQVYVGTTATNTYPFEVGVMIDPNDPNTFVATHNEALAGQSAAYDRAYTFEHYTGDETGTKFGTFIALKPLNYRNAGGTEYVNNAIYIDNVSIDFIETCVKPIDLQTDSVGIYGAKLIWNTDDKTATHRVRVFTSANANPDTDAFVAEGVANDSVVTVEGLDALTTYYAFVRKECGGTDGNSKWSSAWQFKTECPETRSLPYEEGFEGSTDPLADYCWASFMIEGPSGCTSDYKAKSSTSAKKDGARGLYLQYTTVAPQAGGNCVGTHRSAAITPTLDVENLNELILYFDVKSSVNGKVAGVKIEAVSDQTKDADAIYITTINDIEYGSWKKAYVRISDHYTSVQAYKYLRFSTTTDCSAYIDNLVLTKDLNTILPIENLKLQMLTESSVKFSFTEYTPSVEQWQVAYVAAGGDIAGATVKTIDETEYTIENLATNTSYDIYVRGNVDGDAWVGPLTATTIQDPATLPYSTGFEDDADKWVIYKTKTVQGDPYPNFFIVGSAEECLGTGEKALFITNDSASYTYQTKDDKGEIGLSYAWAIRNIKVNAAGTYKFKFKVKVPGNKDPEKLSTDYATAHLFPAGATINAGTATMLDGTTRAGTAVTDVPASNIYSLMDKMYQKDEWIWVNKTLDVEEAGIYSIAIFWYNASVGVQYGQAIAVDSVIAEEYLCTTPKDIEYTNRAANEVSLKWFGGKCKNFEYVLSRYAKLGNPALIDDEDKVAYGTLTDGPAVTLSNLMPQRKYSFYVRTICEDGATDWVEFDFETPCGKYDLPYTEAFFETPECWILKSATQGKTTVGTSAEHEDWYRLSLAGNSGMAVLPELDVDIKNVEIEIGLFNTTANYGAVSLGVMDNTYDLDSYQEVAFFQTQTKPGSTGSYIPTQLEVFNKMMNLYKGSGKVLAIKNATSFNIGVKYITLTELPDCVRPQQIELTFVSENSVTVNWIGGVEEAWEIKVNDSIIENVTVNPYKVTGLKPGTNYSVSVRARCDSEHTSEWSLPAMFQTECSVYALPMIEDFTKLPKSTSSTDQKRAHLSCWDNMVTNQAIEQVFNGNISPYTPAANVSSTYLWITNYLPKLGDDNQLLFFGYSISHTNPKYRWMITPQYAIEGDASLSFDVKHVDNQGLAAYPNGRFFVAISTDNGDTWKKADATEITDIDSVMTTKSVSLNKYAGQNIRVAFYMEDLNGTTTTKGSGIFTLVDNVRMNCTETYPYADNACQGFDYEGYGFSIAKEDLPIAGKDSTYYRFAANAEGGCDSTIALTITTRKAAEVAPVYAEICRGESYDFGPYHLTEPNPVGTPYYISGETQYGCDSTIYLYLTVNESDTTDMSPVEVKANQLPYIVDEYYTIPMDASIGSFTAVAKRDGCSFNRYFITVLDNPTGIINITDEIDYIEVYDALGRKVQTLRQGDSQNNLPRGVYMIRTIMKNGNAVNRKETF